MLFIEQVFQLQELTCFEYRLGRFWEIMEMARGHVLLCSIKDHLQLILYILQTCNLDRDLFEVEAASVVGVEHFDENVSCVALLEVLVVVEVTIVGGKA